MKILIISHTPVSTQNNMGKTFLSLFSSFSPEELCQLYIYPSYPNAPYCSSFYRVTDKDVLKKLKPGGEVDVKEIHEGQRLYENAEDESLYRDVKNKSPVRRLLRDGIWQMAHWYNKQLKAWLAKEQPTCIFLAPGAARFIYSIALKISKEWNIPIVTYICDEYYFVSPEKTWLGRLRLSLLKRKIEQVMRHTTHIVAISEEIRELYSAHFSVPATLLMTGSQHEPSKTVDVFDHPQTLSYFGNIRLNRYRSLAAIGRELDRINQERKTAYVFNIYTGEKDSVFLDALRGNASIQLHGFLSGEDFENAMRESDVLVHTEAFDEESVDRVRHSVSTKIADSLTYGIPLFAYGPPSVSSMKHLIKHRCAVIASSEAELHEALCRLLDDAKLREKCVKNALNTARHYHSTVDNSQRLYEMLRDIR